MLTILLAAAETLGDVVVAGHSQCQDHLHLVSFGDSLLLLCGS